MTEDDAHRRSFSDDELAFLRHVQFGELPQRISPEDRIELTETDQRRDRPEPEPAPWYPAG